jgi:hypothetical protein
MDAMALQKGGKKGGKKREGTFGGCSFVVFGLVGLVGLVGIVVCLKWCLLFSICE